MRSLFVLAFLALGTLACQPMKDEPRPYKVYPQNAEYFQSLINPIGTEAEPGITLRDDLYPIKVKLYEDGRFQYTLKKLGDGWGTWRYAEADGYIDLYAERTLFVMQMQIRSTDPGDPEAIALEFSDRFGPKYLKLLK